MRGPAVYVSTMNKIILTLAGLFAPQIIMAAPLPEHSDLLATNTVVAVYEKTVDRPCRHLTSLCPDRCNHAKKLATFRVVVNENYEHPGQYGDDKSEPGSVVYVDMLHDEPGQDESVRKLISELKPGDAVRIRIDHYYVNGDSCKYPVRPVTLIERVEKPANIPPAKDKEPIMEIMPLAR